MDVTRSGFLKGMAASACLAGAGCRMAGGAPVPGAHDPNLVVVISDVHTGLPWSKQQYRTGREYPWMPEAAKRLVRAILAMDPQPSLVLDLGDLSLAFGEEGDYEIGAEVFRPLTDAGIQVVHTMGNHDIRANFLKCFPGADAGTKVPGRFTHVVSTPHADFIVLDSLQEPVRRGSYDACTVKGLGKEQTDWLKATLLETKRPTFVCAHHAIPELGVARHVARCPYVVGSLHGHNHHWATDYFADGDGLLCRWLRKERAHHPFGGYALVWPRPRHRLRRAAPGCEVGEAHLPDLRLLLSDAPYAPSRLLGRLRPRQ